MKRPLFYGIHSAGLLAAGVLLAATQHANATLLDPYQSPLILSESVAPNLILTLDNSGSMFYAFVPDDIETDRDTRRVKSAYGNPMYYNPTVTYTTPVKFNTDGSRASDTTQYSSTFTSAPTVGLNAANVTEKINLSNDYKVTWAVSTTTGRGTTYANSFTQPTLAENPAADFNFTATQVATIATSTTSTPFTNNNITYTITRPASGASCTATLISGGSGQTLTCSRSGSTYTIGNTSNKSKAGVPAYYYVFDTTQPSCTTVAANQKNDDNCYRLVFVSATSGIARTGDAAGIDERDNFARWYSFYRSRNLATLSAANLAFIGLPSTIRLTWQALANSCVSFDGSDTGKCKNNRLRKFTQLHRGAYFNWLPTITFAAGGTPLRPALVRAGEYLRTATPWASNPNPFTANGGDGTTVNDPVYSCRASYHILMTDGMWNGANGTPSGTVVTDKTNNLTLPDGKIYTQQKPFFDATDDTLADLAFHYWATDLRTTIDNNIKPVINAPNATAATQYWDPRNDPANWQHMSTYTIGLGLNAALNKPAIPWTGDTFSGAGYDALKAGTQSWPATAVSDDNNVYDLWHSAINSRGEFFSADSPDKVVEAFTEIINRISNRDTSAGAPGVTASIVEDSLTRDVYETKLNSEDWSGNLTKFSVSSSGVRSAVWNAQTTLTSKTATTRSIKMVGSSGTLTDFSWDNLSPDQKAMLSKNADATNTPTDTKGEARLNYIRGDQTGEGSTQFRIRSSVLGDIINSSPVIVGTPKYVAYLADAIEGSTGASSYATFKSTNRAELVGTETSAPRRPMVYVGANDGMLHGFDANTGEERFAFVPSAVIPNLYRLPALNYTGAGHRYFVDGTPVVNDVYYDGAWHTVLVGTLRAGGRSLFALDITNPDAITLLWEKSFADTGLSNLGYTFPQPVIARLHSGNWAVVTGNGYGNQAAAAADNASLMIFDIQTGALQSELVVTGDATIANGLSSVRLADNNSDGVADYAYAGDLQGNMWRFDLVTTSATPVSPDPFKRGTGFLGTINPNRFAVSYGGTPLYSATDSRTSGATRQAIMAPPSLVRHPSTLGYLVIFGTGKYFENGDGAPDSTRAMTLYGIWDRKTKGQTTSARSSALTRSNLQAQTITSQPTNPFTTNDGVEGIRIVSQNTVQWYSTSATGTADSDVNKWGWALDLKVSGTSTFSGEMVINPMATRGQTLLLNTLTPNADPCKEGVDSWLYGLDPFTGGRTKFNVFDLDNSKTIDNNDSFSNSGTNTVVSSYKKPGSGGFTTNNGDIYTAPSQGGGMKYSAGPTSSGRQTWRVIPERETSE